MIPASLSPIANHLWQSTLFTVAAWLLTLALRKNRAAIRYWLWLAASLKFVVPFSLLVSTGSQFGIADDSGSWARSDLACRGADQPAFRPAGRGSPRSDLQRLVKCGSSPSV